MIHAKIIYMKFNKILNRRSKSMKKVLMIALAVLISVAFVTTVFAQKPAEKAAAEKAAGPAAEKAAGPAAEKAAKPAAEKAAEKAAKPAAEKAAKVEPFKGEFVSADATAKTIIAKSDKGEMTFDVSKIKKMAEFKAGDKIVVVYKEKDGKNWAKSVKAAKTKKAEKAAAEKAAGPAAEKAAKPAAEKAAGPAAEKAAGPAAEKAAPKK